jgi:hypothetical protein
VLQLLGSKKLLEVKPELFKRHTVAIEATILCFINGIVSFGHSFVLA